MTAKECDITFHYPPELLQLLVDAIPRLCRSKKDVLLFFQGAGVASEIQEDLKAKVEADRSAVNKFEIARTILTRLNEKGEPTLRVRREVLKRVVEFEEFSSCWPEDQLKAKGLVAEIRKVIDAKDAFTRMRLEKEKAQKKHSSAYLQKTRAQQERDSDLEQIRKGFSALFTMDNRRERGIELEGILNKYFKLEGILVREAFCRVGEEGAGIVEQIDGVIDLDGRLYLVEMKWLADRTDKGDVSAHLVNVFTRGDVGGIFISASDYTRGAIDVCKEALTKKAIALCTLEEISLLLESRGSLRAFLIEKVRAAVLDKVPFKKITKFDC